MTIRVDLSGRTAVVTGASSGLGSDFARTLAQTGASVILAARRKERVEGLALAFTNEGMDARGMSLDVTSPLSIASFWSEVGAVDILVNNAGVALNKPMTDHTEDDWDSVVGTNARGAFLVAQGAAKAMIGAGRGGSIINIASILGLRQAGNVGAYAISKAAVVQMTKVMALEWARHKIRVNALCPGYIDTELNREFWQTEAGQKLIRRIPQRRLGDVEDLRGALLLLASESSRYMTGSEIVVDGGHLVSSL